ncbi:MAG: hypothetical protein JEY94_05715 [Melioribacteraceae bacterium]|nr:hypothetical protein [Melioribacteraceae bacterium]
MSNNRLGTAPVFFTAISTILGAILFLRFGYAIGELGFYGVFLIIIIGHLVTLPTALALSEISTNRRVEGGGEYFIISRSFGLNIGATIGIALYLSQAISVAFYVIAFSEAFTPVFDWVLRDYGYQLSKQVVSIPAMLILSILIIKKGANIGIAALYVVVTILFISLAMFFLGGPINTDLETVNFSNFIYRNPDNFFIVFAIIFPAFTGMTAGVGLSGDLKDAKKSIPVGTILATVMGMIIYGFIIWKLSISADELSLSSDQFIMSKIALGGAFIIPLGLAASTISSAIGSILVAPRTIQAIGVDKSFPIKSLNSFFAKGKGDANEPINGSIVTSVIAFLFVIMGDVDAVAKIISMFFMVTYGAICLISFLHHFGADPSYRPTFKSRWYFSFIGFLMCFYLMFKMEMTYAFLSILGMLILYFVISTYHKKRGGLESIFQNAIFQLIRNVHVYIQQSRKSRGTWRPSAVCISEDSFEREKAFELLNWISYKHGFGTYIHFTKGYYSTTTNLESRKILNDLIKRTQTHKGNMYIDTIISPSYTSAIAQVLQLPSSSGMENNMIIFEYEKHSEDKLTPIIENISLTQAGSFDVCVLASSSRSIIPERGIHMWIRNLDEENANLMILLSYIILGHPSWHNSSLKIFNVCEESKIENIKNEMKDLILTSRIPITEKNISIIKRDESRSFKDIVNETSREAGLTIIGFKVEQLKNEGKETFQGYDNIGDVLFILANGVKDIY